MAQSKVTLYDYVVLDSYITDCKGSCDILMLKQCKFNLLTADTIASFGNIETS